MKWPSYSYVKRAIALIDITNNQLLHQDCKKHISRDFLNIGHHKHRTSRSSLLKIQTVLNSTYLTTLAQPLQVTYTRLRLGTTNLTHKYKFMQESRPTCSCSPLAPFLSVGHVLLDCFGTWKESRYTYNECELLSVPFDLSTLLSDESLIGGIFRFLQSTDLLRKI